MLHVPIFPASTGETKAVRENVISENATEIKAKPSERESFVYFI